MGDSLTMYAAADSHLGYSSGSKVHAKTLLNQRVVDGYIAFKDTVDRAIELEVDLFLHGGDIFHKSWPMVTDIEWALKQLRRLSKAGIPVLLNTGNHDASNARAHSPATVALHDPDRNIHVVTGLIEVHRPVPGLTVTALSHMGLAHAERQEPLPVDGDVNLFTFHGAAAVPGHEIFHCIDSPGELPIGLDVLGNPGWDAMIGGHYHGMGSLPGFPHGWYCGSSLRRGFSDPEGGRGGLHVSIGSDGQIGIERDFIRQRPQYDLPMIDAAGLSGADVEELIRMNLAAIDPVNAIIRQVVVNCPNSVKRGIDRPALVKLTDGALVWQDEFNLPEAAPRARPGDPLPSASDPDDPFAPAVPMSTRAAVGSNDLPGLYGPWAADYTKGLPEATRQAILVEGHQHLVAVSTGVESGLTADALPEPGKAVRKAPARRAAKTAEVALDEVALDGTPFPDEPSDLLDIPFPDEPPADSDEALW